MKVSKKWNLNRTSLGKGDIWVGLLRMIIKGKAACGMEQFYQWMKKAVSRGQIVEAFRIVHLGLWTWFCIYWETLKNTHCFMKTKIAVGYSFDIVTIKFNAIAKDSEETIFLKTLKCVGHYHLWKQINYFNKILAIAIRTK